MHLATHSSRLTLLLLMHCNLARSLIPEVPHSWSHRPPEPCRFFPSDRTWFIGRIFHTGQMTSAVLPPPINRKIIVSSSYRGLERHDWDCLPPDQNALMKNGRGSFLHCSWRLSMCSSRVLRRKTLSQYLVWLPEWWQNIAPNCSVHQRGIYGHDWPI